MSTAVDLEAEPGPKIAAPPAAPRTWPLKVALAAVIVVLGVIAWVRINTPDPLALGNRGTATAAVQQDCQSLSIELDDLNLSGKDPIPPSWRGRSIDGTVTLDERTGEHSVRGTFTGSDGVTVAISGGESGKVFFTLACRSWPGG